MSQLAIKGGTPVLPPGTIRPWPPIDESDRQMVLASLEGTNHAYGPNCLAFQEEFAAWNGNRFALTTNSGTAALHMALVAAGCGAGDEVIVPAYTFIATASAVLSVNAVPIFADIDAETYNLDPEAVRRAITDKTRAIIPVHFGGQPADMEALNGLAREHGLAVLEDAAHAHGSEYQGRKCGSLADAGSFSFQASKPMTAGEGGIITTNREELAERCESLVWAGRRKGEPWYRHYELAGNARLTEFQGAILSVQLTRLDEQIATRMRNAKLLSEALSEIEGITPCAYRPTTTRHSFHIYMFRYDPGAFGGLSKGAFVEALQAEGITPAFGGYTTPLYRNPMFLERRFYGGDCPVGCPRYGRELDYAAFAEQCPVAERACATEAVWLTQNALMGGEGEVEAIATAIRKVQQVCCASL